MFKKNKTYNVFVKSAPHVELESAIFVSEGFNLWAFIFNIFFVLYQRLWLLAAIMACGFGVLYALRELHLVGVVVADIIQAGFCVWLALDVAEWQCADLKKKGYVLYDVIIAADQTNAKIRFFDRYLGIKTV